MPRKMETRKGSMLRGWTRVAIMIGVVAVLFYALW